jgi:hypothetical protein
MAPNSIRPYDFYGPELHTQTQNIFCRNWMELNANFGLQGTMESQYLIINSFIVSIEVIIDNVNTQTPSTESKYKSCQHFVKSKSDFEAH